MTYLIRYIRDGEVIAAEEFDEKPEEDFLRDRVAEYGASFADVSRKET